MKKTRRSNTILHKIIIPVALVLMLQACLLCGILYWGGPLEASNRNAFNVMESRTAGRANILENNMVQNWSNLAKCQQALANCADEVTASRNISFEELGTDTEAISEFLTGASQSMIDTLRQNGVTGIYVILNGSETPGEDAEKAGLYLRDYNPNAGSLDNTDLFIEKAPVSVCRYLGIPLDINWKSHFSLNENSSYYYNPYNAYKYNPALGTVNSGCWSGPVQVTENDISILTYSQPLLASDNTCFGVLGVSISLDYLREMLPASELSSGNSASYLLVQSVDSQQEEPSYKIILSSGSSSKYYLGDASEITFSSKAVYGNIYPLKNSSEFPREATLYGNITPLKLYNTNTPFERQSLYLIGISDKDHVLSFAAWLKHNCFYLILVSLAVGISAAFLISYRISTPIIRLSKKVKMSSPYMPVHLDKIQISEIDQLVSSIEDLSASVAEQASRISKILDMASVPIAAFEYKWGEPTAFCSKNFFQMIGQGEAQPDNFTISYKDFKVYMEDLKEYIQSYSNSEGFGIYRLRDEHGQLHWFRMQILETKEAVTGVITDITLEMAEKHRLEYERDYDILTGLPNRRAFLATMTDLFSRPEELKNAALIMIDLDNLKYINDTYGHDWGDEYLKSAAHVFKNLADKTAVTARLSGDEFNVFFYGYETKEHLEDAITDMRCLLLDAHLTVPDGSQFKLRASAGIAWYPENSTVLDELIKFADFAMYQVKHSDKGNIQAFDMSSYKKESYLLNGKEDLHQLIEQRLISYAFQPIVEVATGKVLGYEALMRPQVPTLKSPLDVLTIAKSQSMLQPIEALTWRTAPDVYFNQHMKGRTDCPLLFINSIPNQRLSDLEAIELVQKFGANMGHIVLELTEIAQMSPLCLSHKKQLCHQYHMEIALDDFGAGHNSEGVLLSIMPEYVKLDIELIHNIDKDKNRLDFLENLIIYFKSKNIKIIAEGVETLDELKVLTLCGVDYIQGYFFGKPQMVPSMPLPEALEALAEARGSGSPRYLPND
jgi:diguanylate cyclase (GGDEF)-like protein